MNRIKLFAGLLIILTVNLKCTSKNECSCLHDDRDKEYFIKFSHFKDVGKSREDEDYVPSDKPFTRTERDTLMKILKDRGTRFIVTTDSDIYVSTATIWYDEMPLIDNEIDAKLNHWK